MLFGWSRLASRDEVRAWLAGQLTTAEDAAWVLSLLMNRASSNGQTRYYIKPSFVQDYVELEEVEKSLRNVNNKQLSKKEKIAVREFRRALQRKREGKPELDTMRTFDVENEDSEEGTSSDDLAQ